MQTYIIKKLNLEWSPEQISISMRPKIVEKKTRIGDFEIDTIVSAKHTGKSCLLTMVDRRSKVTFSS